MMYLITLVTSITMLSSFSRTFITIEKCNRVVFPSILSGAVHLKVAVLHARFFFFFTLFYLFKKFNRNISYEGYYDESLRKI